MKSDYTSLHALYRAARREEEPTRADRRVVRAALLSAGATAVAVQASAATVKLMGVLPAATKVFTVGQLASLVSVGLALGTGVAVVGVAASPKHAAPAFAVTAPPRQNPKPVAVRRTVPEPAFAPEPSIASANAEPSSSPSPNNQEPATNNQPPIALNKRPVWASQQPATNNQQPVALLAESRGLAEVQGALNAQDPARALALLAAQDTAFRSGALGQERDAARVIALCAAGRANEAAVLRDQFLSVYPSSPLAKRVSKTCKK